MKGVENEVFWSRLRLEDKVKKNRGIWSFTENSHNKHKLRRKDEQGIKGHTSFNYVKHGVEMDRLYKSRTGCENNGNHFKKSEQIFLKTRRKTSCGCGIFCLAVARKRRCFSFILRIYPSMASKKSSKSSPLSCCH